MIIIYKGNDTHIYLYRGLFCFLYPAQFSSAHFIRPLLFASSFLCRSPEEIAHARDSGRVRKSKTKRIFHFFFFFSEIDS